MLHGISGERHAGSMNFKRIDLPVVHSFSSISISSSLLNTGYEPQDLATTTIMHLTKIISSIILAVTASAAPFVSPEVSLSKRQATSDGQAGAYISSPDGVAFTSVLGGKICLGVPYRFLHPIIVLVNAFCLPIVVYPLSLRWR
jgi:uncharacterized protein YqjF (DUF2071 family)